MPLSASSAISYADATAHVKAYASALEPASGAAVQGTDNPMAKSQRTGSLRRAAARASQSARQEAEGMPSLPLDLPVDQLLSAIETQLIPRLMVNHQSMFGVEDDYASTRQKPEPGDWSTRECVEQFGDWCLVQGSDRVTEHVSDLLSRGVNLDAIYIYLIAPAANYLGERWASDDISFIDVQLGLTRMHQLVNECDRIGYRVRGRTDGRSILLSAAPGEQHTFGIKLAADFYERSGWVVSNLAGYNQKFILQRVAANRYSAVGLSLHNAAWLDALRTLIPMIREQSINKDVLVVVGGDFFVRNPGVGDTLGIDIIALDAHQAVLDTEAMLGEPVVVDERVPV